MADDAETVTATDRTFLERAAQLSLEGIKTGAGGPFGAVVVMDGRVVAEGCNEVTSSNDPTAHAEVTAIRKACATLGTFDLSGAVIYASCEPCPMCLAAIYWARIGRLVYANTRHQAAGIGFDDAAIYEEVPKPPGERSLPTMHLPCDTAEEAFRQWTALEDKIPY